MNILVDIYSKKLQLMEDIKNESKRWESIPNGWEPMSKDMVKFLIKK